MKVDRFEDAFGYANGVRFISMSEVNGVKIYQVTLFGQNGL